MQSHSFSTYLVKGRGTTAVVEGFFGGLAEIYIPNTKEENP